MLIDVPEDAAAIKKTMAQIELEEMLEMENTKEEIYLELSSRNISNLKTIN